MEARPTQYNGIVFRSKSEAQLALIFDLNKKYKHNYFSDYDYEPRRLETSNGYIPDFMRMEYFDSHMLPLFIEIIEYKPIKPNKTYLEYLEKQFTEIHKNDGLKIIDGYLLYFGSVYNKDISCKIFNKGENKFNDYSFHLDWIDKFYDECSKYRFDL